MTVGLAPTIAGLALLAVLLVMAGEAVLARFNEQALLRRGAREAPDDVYSTMQWAYPFCFVAMAIEGAIRGPSPATWLVYGLALYGLSKALKAWVITTLGPRWTFRVIVPTNEPLIVSGPYRFLNHPNYVAVAGELISFAMIVWAPVTCVLAVLSFGALMRARIRVEDRALGRAR